MDWNLASPLQVGLTGVGATALMDLWLWGLRRLKLPGMDMALLGRWLGHGLQGRWRHAQIARAAPVAGERLLGWGLHYGTGVAFAGLLALVVDATWWRQPEPGTALVLGVATVLAPFCIMQPAMGAGLAASRTPTPWRNRLRSLASHMVFGLGLYLSARVLAACA